ncbi:MULTISPECIES: hypothetical protein [Limnospira]|uniref:Uncharacterized protein n=1 Tax=Limnospira maxima CS-328 TaxID=513049 RepID=B5VV82_LIMMA|nr:hypothetical protein AmaxDRAFT_0416 [Limnospira maxima CS-328]
MPATLTEAVVISKLPEARQRTRPNIGANFLPCRDSGSNDIASLKAFVNLSP